VSVDVAAADRDRIADEALAPLTMRVHLVDAFTDRAFAGNPAAVCLLDAGEWPDAGWMQRVATELNMPMTAFVLRQGEAWGLRWFTPLIEERLCGHATLATAFLLGGERPLRFHTRAGVLSATVSDDGTVTLDFPAAEIVDRDPIEGLAHALGAAPTEVHGTGELRDVLAVFDDEAAVRGLTPRFDALADVTRREDIRGVTATARGTDHDFVSRFFSPADGLPEDPVTGSAHCALAPFWAQRLGAAQLVGHQVSARGGLVRTELAGDRVLLSGSAVVVLDGELQV
jgi:PhzF family phenazine biosynthesis protein